MVYLAGAGYSTVVGINHRRPIFFISIITNSTISTLYVVVSLCRGGREHGFSSASESAWTDFPVENAYELLRVSETSSFAEIKSSFRKLAKETHPDLAESRNDSSASRRFVQILAAYEILSDSQKRAHYDMYLLSQKKLVQKHSGQGSKLHIYKSHATTFKDMEVVEWLKWYRLTINNILLEKEVVVGTGYFDVLERDFYSAIHAAYYGPEIDSMPMELLPDCFEAEERSTYETPEVLHLVSGRDLFGMVCLVNKVPEISTTNNEKLTSFRSFHSGPCQSITNVNVHRNAERPDDFETHPGHGSKTSSIVSDAYRHLELHISGRVVATASRALRRFCSDAMQTEDAEDHIHVFLNLYEDPKHISSDFCKDYLENGAVGRRIHLGTIAGLGSSPDEGCCYVYNDKGTKTHVIMKHRTLMVKHMHWYQVDEKVSVCECRCTRARLPPSKFWLFEPRCGFHDIGGWYVETYGKKNGRTMPSQRFWDGLDYSEQADSIMEASCFTAQGVSSPYWKGHGAGQFPAIYLAIVAHGISNTTSACIDISSSCFIYLDGAYSTFHLPSDGYVIGQELAACAILLFKEPISCLRLFAPTLILSKIFSGATCLRIVVQPKSSQITSMNFYVWNIPLQLPICH